MRAFACLMSLALTVRSEDSSALATETPETESTFLAPMVVAEAPHPTDGLFSTTMPALIPETASTQETDEPMNAEVRSGESPTGESSTDETTPESESSTDETTTDESSTDETAPESESSTDETTTNEPSTDETAPESESSTDETTTNESSTDETASEDETTTVIPQTRPDSVSIISEIISPSSSVVYALPPHDVYSVDVEIEWGLTDFALTGSMEEVAFFEVSARTTNEWKFESGWGDVPDPENITETCTTENAEQTSCSLRLHVDATRNFARNWQDVCVVAKDHSGEVLGQPTCLSKEHVIITGVECGSHWDCASHAQCYRGLQGIHDNHLILDNTMKEGICNLMYGSSDLCIDDIDCATYWFYPYDYECINSFCSDVAGFNMIIGAFWTFLFLFLCGCCCCICISKSRSKKLEKPPLLVRDKSFIPSFRSRSTTNIRAPTPSDSEEPIVLNVVHEEYDPYPAGLNTLRSDGVIHAPVMIQQDTQQQTIEKFPSRPLTLPSLSETPNPVDELFQDETLQAPVTPQDRV